MIIRTRDLKKDKKLKYIDSKMQTRFMKVDEKKDDSKLTEEIQSRNKVVKKKVVKKVSNAK